VPVLGGGVGAVFGSHGGAATVADVPAGRDVVVPAVPPVSGVVREPADGMLDDEEVVGAVFCEVELLELPVVVPLLDGVHGATVFVV